MTIEAGVQLHLPTYRDLALSELLAIAKTASDVGFDQIWVTDNLESRSNFVVLGAMAQLVTTKLGTAIMAQYFRSPLEAAASLIPLSEMMGGRELTVGLGTGNVYTSTYIEMPRPIGFMRETAVCLRHLLNGEKVNFHEYPLLGEYFHFKDAPLEAAMRSSGPVRIFGGGNGPLGCKLAGEVMDGLLSGWTTLPNATLGKLDEKIALANNAAKAAGHLDTFSRVTELKISIGRDHQKARDYVRHHSAALRTLSMRKRGYSDDNLRALGVDPKDLDKIEEAHNKGIAFRDLDHLVTDAMIDFGFIAGDPTFCAERMTEIAAIANKYGFEQIIFSELGPDQVEASKLIADKVLPALFAVTS